MAGVVVIVIVNHCGESDMISVLLLLLRVMAPLLSIKKLDTETKYWK